MPNYCDYDMRVVGKKENVDEFINVIKADYDYGKEIPATSKHLFRVFGVDVLDDYCYTKEDGRYSCDINGYCAWSVYVCMLEGIQTYYNDLKERYPDKFMGTSLLKLSKELNLDIEVFSDEPGVGFREHYLIKNGEFLIDDCIDLEYEETEEDEIICITDLDCNFSI